MQKPTFKQAVKFWVKLGFISFGGPAGQIAIMHEYLVDKMKWISNSRFLHALNYCMILPGPEAQQLATYIGWLLHGTVGGLAAGLLFVLPSMFMLLGLSVMYVSFGNIPWVYAMFAGLKPAVIAIIIVALIKIGKRSLISPLHYIIAVAAFVCIFFFSAPFPLIIIAAILLAVIGQRLFPALFKLPGAAAEKTEGDETDYYINKHTSPKTNSFSLLKLCRQVITALLLWLLPLAILYFLTPQFTFWKTLSVFFTKAAFVTFGGAYAVLPYVAQVSVQQFNWLTNAEMVDGLALGETTPGPLIMVLAFVGFMAGYNHFDSSLTLGALGLVATTFYTFLPCFLFIFVGAPVIERTRQNNSIKQVLSLVTAAVVGVILNLTIYLGKTIFFPNQLSLAGIDYITLSWAIISFIAMYRLKISMILWIGVSVVFGLVNYTIMR